MALARAPLCFLPRNTSQVRGVFMNDAHRVTDGPQHTPAYCFSCWIFISPGIQEIQRQWLPVQQYLFPRWSFQGLIPVDTAE